MKKTVKVFLLSISFICSIIVTGNTLISTNEDQFTAGYIVPLGDDDIKDIHNY